MNYKREAIHKIALALKSYGYRVYVSGNGTHGFYTDGVRCVSFEYGLGEIRYSGNYITDQPRYTGTGWGIEDGVRLSADLAERMVKAHAPRWAVGNAKVEYATPEQHLKRWGASSKYTELT